MKPWIATNSANQGYNRNLAEFKDFYHVYIPKTSETIVGRNHKISVAAPVILRETLGKLFLNSFKTLPR